MKFLSHCATPFFKNKITTENPVYLCLPERIFDAESLNFPPTSQINAALHRRQASSSHPKISFTILPPSPSNLLISANNTPENSPCTLAKAPILAPQLFCLCARAR